MSLSYEEFSEEIEQAFQALENAFGITITIHDLRGTISHPDGKVLLEHRHLHRHPCCMYKRDEIPDWDKRCFHDCFTKSEQVAVIEGRAHFKTCWKGMVEMITPLIHNQHHVLTLYSGPFKVESEQETSKCPSDPVYQEMVQALPLFDEEKLLKLNSLLVFVGHGILHYLSQDLEEEDTTRGTSIKHFIHSNAHRQITVKDLAKHLHLSPSRASHAVREYTGMTFSDLLLKERMLRAKALLLQSEQSLVEISEKLGFKTVFYFSRVFKKFYGNPPGKFRKNSDK